ncbi:MAG: ABC transporter permease [Acidimicrobiia bacterium]
MIGYIVRRVALAIPVLIGIVVVVFVLARLAPGDPCTSALGEKATVEACERFNEANGLNRSILVQLAIYMGNVLRGDLGDSIRFSRPVTDMLIERLPLTMELAISALALAIIVGIPAGLIAARRHNTAVDVATMAAANVGVSMPVFWLGLMLQFVFALVLKDTIFGLPPSGRVSAGVSPVPFYVVWGWELGEGFPSTMAKFLANFYLFNTFVTGQWEIFQDAVRHLILPTIALATIPTAIIARMTRSSLLEVLGKDYIRTAHAKGAGQRRVIRKHAFQNAMLPVTTIVGLQLGLLLGGAVLTETIFNLAGVGRSLFEAITSRDYPVIQGFTLVIASIYVVVNLLVDISYGYLDPRIQLR